MSDNRTDRIRKYIEQELENGYTRKQVVAMLVHAWDMDVLEAQDTVGQVQADWTASEKKRRRKVKVQLVIGGIFLAEAVVHAYIFGPVIAAGASAIVGIVLFGFALKNMR